MNQLLIAIGKYAASKGEAWRIGEGVEIMDAYEAETDGMVCEDCNGAGEVGEEIYQGEFQPPERSRCESCGGSGRWKINNIQT